MSDELLKEHGFKSSAEFHKMVSDVDLSSAVNRIAFQFWKENDGTKAGLEELATINH